MSKFLVGKTINKIMIADDKQALLFMTDDGDHVVRVDADCCSHTWVESIEAPALGFPALVAGAEDLDLNMEDEEKDGEYIAFYGFKISTNKGDIIIDYRNESNGYYGGNLVWPDDNYFYGGVYGQNVSDENWKEIEFE